MPVVENKIVNENGGFLGQFRRNSTLIIITLLTNLIFTIFWVATQAARINVTELAITENKTNIIALTRYTQDFITRVDRLDTPLSRRVVELERQVEILDNRVRLLSERIATQERK